MSATLERCVPKAVRPPQKSKRELDIALERRPRGLIPWGMLVHRGSWRSCTFIVAALLVGGCDRVLGFQETRLVPDAAPDAPDPLACADLTVASALEPVAINTETAVDDLPASCGQDGGKDQLVAFTAPVTDYYAIDTFGSSFDTVLAVYDQCGGAELACNNDAAALPQSELVRKFQQGERALLVVEGAAGDSGAGVVNVARVTCPDADLEGSTFPVSLNTTGFGDDGSSACGGAGSEDRSYHWVAPKDGLYAFKVTSAAFAPAISLRDGPRCQDRSLGCGRAEPGLNHSEVVRRLRAGQAVSIDVDGMNGAGAFEIDVIERTAACPQSSLGEGLALPAEAVGPRVLAPSCGAVDVTGMFGGRFDLGDKSYAFRVSAAFPSCVNSCFINVTAQEEMILYALEGNDCSGAEFACVPTQFSAATGKHTAQIRLRATAGKAADYVIVVADGRAEVGSPPTYALQSECFQACP